VFSVEVLLFSGVSIIVNFAIPKIYYPMKYIISISLFLAKYVNTNLGIHNPRASPQTTNIVFHENKIFHGII
jgi:hypothetical protein